jgi:hypothetical protein
MSFVVLPWIGEGIAGSHYLSAAGMIYFAVARNVFFVLLTLLYVRFTRRNEAESASPLDVEA